MSRAKDLATMIFRCSAGYVRKAPARHLLRAKNDGPIDATDHRPAVWVAIDAVIG